MELWTAMIIRMNTTNVMIGIISHVITELALRWTVRYATVQPTRFLSVTNVWMRTNADEDSEVMRQFAHKCVKISRVV
ncbi:hypothetical protein ANCDUO_18407 [Ancylostoma duodenale]|uniref:Uncharacterized protein n=1 Tax=Ancylostoma duodenale TaxID=51022 RepID=A0A0C2C5E8_9BILA|nr:hypothetical protein ANCDUO_18407 [Ancylostoma duodenale]